MNLTATLKQAFDELYAIANNVTPAALEQAAQRQRNKCIRILIQTLCTCLLIVVVGVYLTDTYFPQNLSFEWRGTITVAALSVLGFIIQIMSKKAWDTARDHDVSAYNRYTWALEVFKRLDINDFYPGDVDGLIQEISRRIVSCVTVIKATPQEKQLMDLNPDSIFNRTRRELLNLVEVTVTLKLFGCYGLVASSNPPKEDEVAEAYYRKLFDLDGF